MGGCGGARDCLGFGFAVSGKSRYAMLGPVDSCRAGVGGFILKLLLVIICCL